MSSAATASWQPRLGDVVAVRDARGFWLRKVVVALDTGRDFPCHDVAWQDEQEWSPWPIECVEPLAKHPDALTREECQRVGR